eukprot:Skav211008  [mRNA]  locus=scaffold1610:388726:395296:+ [translate_table: standard]
MGCKATSDAASPDLQQQVLTLTDQVELSKNQTEQVAAMVERLAETLQKQALDASNMEQAFVRSESKMIGLQASSVSVLEGRLRVFVKTELDHAVLAAMEDCSVMQRLEVVESAQRQLVEAVEEEAAHGRAWPIGGMANWWHGQLVAWP